MKKLIVALFIIFLAGCGNEKNNLATTESGTGTTSGETTDLGDDEFVFIGSFAQWNLENGEQYDGNYDSTRNLFQICSTSRYETVPKNEIRFAEFATCDAAPGSRFALMKMDKNETGKFTGVIIKVEGDKGIVEKQGTKRIILLDFKTLRRIETEKKDSELMYEKNTPRIKTDDELSPQPSKELKKTVVTQEKTSLEKKLELKVNKVEATEQQQMKKPRNNN